MQKLLIILFLVFSATQIFAQDATKKQGNISKSGLAVEGYDPVAYFTVGKAIEGKKDITASDAGVTYYFSSAQNRDLFKADPAKYKPQYGGWCAYAMGESGEKVEIDPGTFKIINGKLYLFYNKYFNNTLKSWNKDEPNLKKKADTNWIKFSK
ncbi:YHS domain-containing (seleno)protein [Dyadobacter arcticus]|uniref:YHS domain-containing protein n=1 Tax=Dyadobacter arcticus TaxID=1078754 RepID=A0ABX0UIX5_9BACT|nr:YHS domain-containing (seleno)protein [Dyadobacter arcticus]NIJ52939.1 YHS domain-containing protein [Dyadobacter arcticus]